MMKHILISNGHLNVGGVEKSLIDMLRSFDFSSYSVDLLLFEGLGDYADLVPQEVRIINWDLSDTYGSTWEVTKRAIKQKSLMLIMYKIILTLANKCDMRFLKLLRLFRETPFNYDYAVAYRVGMPADYTIYSVRAKKKAIWWHHGEFKYDEKTVSRWAKEFEKADQIVCVSEYTKDLIYPHFSQSRDKMIVIPNMIPINTIRTLSEQFNPYENQDGSTILVSVGRLSEEKHMEDCVTVAQKLKTDGIHFIWVLVGDGEEKEQIEKKIVELGMQDQVLLAGSKSNPYPYIKYADIFVHPSHVESQGIAVLEAMALGKLCVVVKSGGTNEYVCDNVNAIQAEPTIESLYEQVRIAIEFRPSFFEEAKNTAELYSSGKIMKRLYQTLE